MSSKPPATVETRTASQSTQGASGASTSQPPAVARPGYYLVKRGDTLYSIATAHGKDFREVARWNNLTDPSQIAVGQELRVVSPEVTVGEAGTGVTKGVTQAKIEGRPLETSRSENAGVLAEPRGGRIAYSDKAWRELQTPAVPAPVLAQASSSAVTKVEPKPVKPPVTGAESAPKAVEKASEVSAEKTDSQTDSKSAWVWPASGKVLSSFNDGAGEKNRGVDIAGSPGDAVLASAAGKVIYAGSDLRGYGNLVIIQHNSKYTTVYAHNREILVKEKQQVQKGQKIAVMGNSEADRTKLHFEVRVSGKPLDPLKFLPSR